MYSIICGAQSSRVIKAPIIVFEDADLISAINGAAFAAFVASGQTCVSGTRLLVQDAVYQEFISLFLEKVESIRHRMGRRSYLTDSHVQLTN